MSPLRIRVKAFVADVDGALTETLFGLLEIKRGVGALGPTI
jgi:hypothetical protein